MKLRHIVLLTTATILAVPSLVYGLLLDDGSYPKHEVYPSKHRAHEVRKGESLWTISQRYEMSFSEILKLNPSSNFRSNNRDLIQPREIVNIIDCRCKSRGFSPPYDL